MNIALTEREQQLLSSFATKQYEGAKDNVGTKTPIHVVERIQKQYIKSNEGNAWLWSDGYDYTEYFDSFDDMLEHERQFSGRDLPQYSEVEYEDVETPDGKIWIDDEKAYCKAFDIQAYKCFVVEDTKPVAFFFIRDEAVRYKDEYQAHNCENCRIYTYSLGYSNNGDLPVFRELLMRMGEILNKELEDKSEGKAND